MYNYKIVNKQEFFEIVKSIIYKEEDEKEAQAMGFPSIGFLYRNTKSPYQRYYIVEKESQVLATIVLKRDGNLEYFITDKVTPYMIPSLVRTVKKLADETVEAAGPIFTTTMESYIGAIRFNELVGFRKIGTNTFFSVWAYGGED